MDLLLDPNVAYLVLLGAALIVMMALLTPGTGLLEVAALIAIGFAGYAIYRLSFNWWALVLLGVSILPFIYAIQKPKRELFLALSILLLVVGSVFMFPHTQSQTMVNPVVAIVASVLVTGFVWIAVRKSMEAAGIKPLHDLTRIVGQVGEARTKVNSEGSVLVAGELWSARSTTPIPAGSSVRVLGRDGFILIVEKNS